MFRITLRTTTGFLCAENGGDDRGVVHGNRPQAGAWETLTVQRQDDGTVALRTINGRYLCAEGSGGGDLHANRIAVGAWERWRVVGELADGANVALRAVDDRHFLGVNPDPLHTVQVLSTDPVMWKVMVVEADAAPTPLPEPNRPAADALSRLTRRGNDLVNEQNHIVRLEGASFFPAHWLLLERGADAIRPSLRQLRDRYHANCVLIFGMSVNVQRNLFGADPFDPSRYGDHFFDSFRELFSVLAAEGFYGYYPVFPDHGLLPAFDSDGKCIAHWDRLMSVARDIPNLLLKPTNEGASKGSNYINPHLLSFPDFCPVAACDYGVDDPAYASGELPDGHDWGGDRTFGDLHPPRQEGAASVVLDCTAVNNIYFKRQRGLAISEAVRLGSNGSAGATRELARLVGLASRVGTLMRVFHSLQGEKCELFDDTTRDHADAYFTGA